MNSPARTASKKPTSVKALSVLDSSPARMSITLILISLVPSVSSIFIWSGACVTSTISVTSGWKRLSVPRGNSESNARASVFFDAI